MNTGILGHLGGRLGVRLFVVVFLSIIAIETAILLPSYRGYRRDLEQRLEHVGRTIVVMALKPRGHARDRDLYIYARLAARYSELSGGALYHRDGSLIGTFGEPPELVPDDAGDRSTMTRMSSDGKRLEVFWTASELDLPVTMVARLDAEWIGAELNAFIWRFAEMALLIMVFGGGMVMVIFNRTVLRRILFLRQRMVSASEDPEAAAAQNSPLRSRDELDDLAREFNGMIARIAQDIGERRQAEITLRESETALAKAQEIAKIGSWRWSLDDDRLISCSAQFATIYGVSMDDDPARLTTLIKNSVHPGDRDRVTAVLKKSDDEDEGFAVEYRLVLPHGDIRYVIEVGEAVRDDAGDITEHFGTLQDITERKSIENEIKSSQDRLAGILEIAPEAVITIDHHMSITMFNQAAERIFGYNDSEVLGQPIEILMPERFRQGHHGLVGNFSNSPETARLMDQRGDIYGLRKDGSEFPAAASVSKQMIGEERLYTVMIRDITARKRILDELIAAKHEAETANLTKSEFLAAMSHELRTPLNAILGFSDILRNQYLGPLGADQYLGYVENIHLSGDLLLSLLSKLLDISAIETGQKTIEKEALQVEDMITECLAKVAQRAQDKGVELVHPRNGDLPVLNADRRALKQILLNLLTNAIKFTPQGGEASLTVAATNSEMAFIIADNGEGIAPDKLLHVTDPFTRAEKDPLHASEGWGLGLAITKSLVDLHQGKMQIVSEQDAGTTVTVTLPLD